MKRKKIHDVLLGVTQYDVLCSLVRHGCYPKGWVWGTNHQTEIYLEALLKKGLVEKYIIRKKEWRSGREYDDVYYRATANGVQIAKEKWT
jgi:hypothetical protein